MDQVREGGDGVPVLGANSVGLRGPLWLGGLRGRRFTPRGDQFPGPGTSRYSTRVREPDQGA